MTTSCCHPNLVSLPTLLLFCYTIYYHYILLYFTTCEYYLILNKVELTLHSCHPQQHLWWSADPIWWPLLVLLLKFILFWSTKAAAADWTLNPLLMNSLFWCVDIFGWILKLLLNTKTLLKHYKFCFLGWLTNWLWNFTHAQFLLWLACDWGRGGLKHCFS